MPIKNFEDYLDEGIVKTQQPDLSRGKSLIVDANKSHTFLLLVIKDQTISDDNANNIIKICYDIIMDLIRARMLLEGYSATGQGAHEAEVAYLRKIDFPEVDIQFCDQLRYFRNGIMYYGKNFDKDYALKVFNFLKKLLPQLQKK
jgi:hypothetical protein